MDYLSYLISHVVSHSKWKPLYLSKNGPPLSHLLFADDIILYAKTDKTSTKTITDILTYFSRISGQKVNSSKSKLFFSPSTPSNTKQFIISSLVILDTNHLGKYLGFPLTSKLSSTSVLIFLIENIHNKLHSWENRFLSIAGKTTLIKSTLANIPICVMQFIKLPEYTLQTINKISHNFLWGSTTSKRKLHNVNWKQVCKPLHQGGLGILDAILRNLSLIMSLAWRFSQDNNNLLWVTILRAKYQSPQNHSPSPIWKSMILGKSLCDQGSSYLVGDGTDISFWFDTWCSPLPIRSLFIGPLLETESIRTVSQVICNYSWKVDSIISAIPQSILDLILSTYLPLSQQKDYKICNVTSTGKFTKSVYALLCSSNTPATIPTIGSRNFSWLWSKTHTLPKIKFFLWLYSLNNIN